MENFDQNDAQILLADEYVPVEKYLGEEIPNWYCYEHFVASDKKLQVYVNNHTHNLPIVSRSLIFKWMMPSRPSLYSDEDFYSDQDRKAGIYRLSVGQPLSISDEEIKNIAKGFVKVDADYLAKLNQMVSKAFVFHAYKIPIINIRLDEIPDSAFDSLYEIHTGSWAEKVKEIEAEQRRVQQEKKEKSLLQVKDTLKTYPDFLSILKDLVSEKLPIEEVEKNLSGIFVKGI